MAFERGKFGLEYDLRQKDESSGGLGWVFAAIAFVALVSLAWTLIGRFRSDAEDAVVDIAAAEEPLNVEAPSEDKPPPASEPEPPARRIDDSDMAKRPVKLRNLLMRLDEAKKRRDVEMEVTTIEQIRALPGSPAADLDDELARRLGKLNMHRLFDLKSAQWVKEVTVKRGDSASRIAYENGSTLASFARLNGGNVDKVVIGRKLRVMDHPRFTLVIHRRTRTADLSLNGKFFKRYDIQGEVGGKDGAYEFPQSPRTFWRTLGVEFKAADRSEIELLMPAKASVLVAEL